MCAMFRGSLPGWWPGTPHVWGTDPSSRVWAPPGPCLSPGACPASAEWWARPPEPAASSERSAPAAPRAQASAVLSHPEQTFVPSDESTRREQHALENCEQRWILIFFFRLSLSLTRTVLCTAIMGSIIIPSQTFQDAHEFYGMRCNKRRKLVLGQKRKWPNWPHLK